VLTALVTQGFLLATASPPKWLSRPCERGYERQPQALETLLPFPYYRNAQNVKLTSCFQEPVVLLKLRFYVKPKPI